MTSFTKKDTIIVPIFSDEYKVVCTWATGKRLQKVMMTHGHWSPDDDPDSILDGLWGATLHTRGCHPLIILPAFPAGPQALCTLAHEAVHAVEDIFKCMNAPLGGEVFAKSVGAVVRIVLENKPVKKKKRAMLPT